MSHRYVWEVANYSKGDIWPRGQQPKGTAASIEEAYEAAQEECPDFVGSVAWVVRVFKWVGGDLEEEECATFHDIY